MKGKIIKIVSNQYTVLTSDGQQLLCVAMGKLRQGERPVVGDYVEYELLDGQYGIQSLYPRKNQLVRPAIANVDQAMIVMSAVEPDFSTLLVDKLIFLISYADIEPLIVVTKMDKVTNNETLMKEIEDYQKSGYLVILSSKDSDVSELKQALADKVTVLTGQSGVGKSTLLNKLDASFALATQEISLAMGRGKHTTRHTQLYPVAGGWLADTPGFSSLDFSSVDSRLLAESIKDFQVDEPCRFADCRHINEPDCRVKEGVKNGTISAIRYGHYLDVVPLCDQRKEWEK